MADEADLADVYVQMMVEQSLRLLQNRKQESKYCEFCEEFECEILPNGVRSMLCVRCRKEREAEILKVVLPVTPVEQGDSPDDSWVETMIPKGKYRRFWLKRCKG